jgi:hypothetical protein
MDLLVKDSNRNCQYVEKIKEKERELKTKTQFKIDKVV